MSTATTLEPVPPPQASSTATAKRRVTLKTIIQREWGLVLLAVALTLMVWTLVRSDLTGPHSLDDVRIVEDFGGREGLRFQPFGEMTIDLKLECSEVDFRDAERRLIDPGNHTVKLRIGELAPNEHSRPADKRDRLIVPFPESYLDPTFLKEAAEGVSGHVFRVEHRNMRIVKPPLSAQTLLRLQGKPDARPLKTLAYDVKLEGPTELALWLYPGIESDEIVADAITLDETFLAQAEHGKYVELENVSITFDGWCDQVGTKATKKYERAYRQRVIREARTLKDLRLMVKLTVIDMDPENIENVLRFQVRNPEAYRFDFVDPDPLLVERQLRERLGGRLRAPPDLLKKLRAYANANVGSAGRIQGWYWGIEIVNDDLPTEGSKDVDAQIRFVPIDPDLIGEQIVFEPQHDQGKPFRLGVTWRGGS